MASDSCSNADESLRAPPPPSASGADQQQIPRRRKLRILVVDDLTDAADSLALLLRLLGHEVRTAYTGPAALSAAEQFHPDAILLDIGLPELDGYQVAMRLRQTPPLQKACLIAISGYGRESDIRHAYEAGFDLHLLKPVSTERLESLLADLVARLP
jgi:CheY-like chemotaxis protein